MGTTLHHETVASFLRSSALISTRLRWRTASVPGALAPAQVNLVHDFVSPEDFFGMEKIVRLTSDSEIRGVVRSTERS